VNRSTILEIKSERLTEQRALANVRKELSLLETVAATLADRDAELSRMKRQLRSINEKLWEIEDRIRLKEAAAEFDPEFIDLARSIYKNNDERAAIKRKINLMTASEVFEEKSYKNY
jgi:Family of unknown function (DUF6165)